MSDWARLRHWNRWILPGQAQFQYLFLDIAVTITITLTVIIIDVFTVTMRPSLALCKRSVWKGKSLHTLKHATASGQSPCSSTKYLTPTNRAEHSPHRWTSSKASTTTGIAGNPNTTTVSDDSAKLRWLEVRGAQWEAVSGGLCDGRDGWQETWGILTVSVATRWVVMS